MSLGNEFQTVASATEKVWDGHINTAANVSDGGKQCQNWHAVFSQIPRSLTVLASVHEHTELSHSKAGVSARFNDHWVYYIMSGKRVYHFLCITYVMLGF